MSSNFYDTTGLMLGCDVHKYWAAAPPVPVVPKELKAGYVNAAQYYVSPVEDDATRTASLTSDGKRMIQGKCKLEWVPHFPVAVPAPPYPGLEVAEIVLTMVYSSSAPVLRRQCVTGERQPLAICLVWAIGLNLNCADPVKMPTGAVFNLNSVKTQASWQDIVPTVVDWIVDSLAGVITKRLGKKLLDKYFKKIVDYVVRRIVKKLAEGFVKNVTKELLKTIKEKLKPKKFLRDIGVPFV